MNQSSSINVCKEGDNTVEELEPPSCLAREVDKGKEAFLFPELIQFPLKKRFNFPHSRKSIAFYQKYFPFSDEEQWSDWNWQLANSITSLEELKKITSLQDEELLFLENNSRLLPLRITPYYASLLDYENPADPLRKAVIPSRSELEISPEEEADPLHEDSMQVAPGLIHRYPDRVLFLVTTFCASYCRYCTRSRLVGEHNRCHLSHWQWDQAIKYIEEHNEVRDVLISGGDPLTMSDHTLEYLLKKISAISHVEMVRIGTKVPVVLPQRITPKLISILKKFRPLYISIHFTHPSEITPETTYACEKLADAGIPLGSQTVLLKGINDRPEVMKSLMQKLLKIRVKPYYIYQCDLIPGSAHFRTSVQQGLEIIASLRGFTSGYAVPHYVIDAPGGGGKIPLLPDYLQEYENGVATLRNYEGKIYHYYEPGR